MSASHARVPSEKTVTFFKFALFLAIIGVLVAGYASYHHLLILQNGQTSAACNINATFSCDAVALSEYSEFLGFPLAIWGLGYFFSLLVLAGLALKRNQGIAGARYAYGLMAGAGVIASLILAYIAFAILKVGCINCISIYVITLLQLLLVFCFRKEVTSSAFNISEVASTLGIPVLTTGVVVLLFGLVKPSFAPQKPQMADKSQGEIANYTASSLSLKSEDIPLSRSHYSGTGEDYRRGGEEAKVIIHTFSDLQCPACKHMAFSLEQLTAEFGDRILIVFRNYPLDNACNSALPQPMHQYACQLAVMARCSGQYEKFWQFHDLAFKEQGSLSPTSATKWAKQIGLSDNEIAQCQKDASLMDKVKEDIALGNKVGVDATPTVFINGKQFMGHGYDALQFEVKNLLDKED